MEIVKVEHFTLTVSREELEMISEGLGSIQMGRVSYACFDELERIHDTILKKLERE